MHKEESKFLQSVEKEELSDARYEFSRIKYTRSSIAYDRSSLEYDFKGARSEIIDSKKSLESLNFIWNEYWLALGKDRTGLIRRDIERNLLSEYSAAVNWAIKAVEDLILYANSKAADIENQADKIVDKAKKSLEEAEKRKPN